MSHEIKQIHAFYIVKFPFCLNSRSKVILDDVILALIYFFSCQINLKVIIPCSHVNLNPSLNPNPNPNQRFICHVLTLTD